MMRIKRLVKKVIFYREYYRLRTVILYYGNTFKLALRWIFAHTEGDNFYYSLQDRNVRDLASVISLVTKLPIQTIQEYFEEVESNSEVQERVRSSWNSNRNMKDAQLGLARRVGWYALIRATKPSLVVETGVSHGLGALVICAALERNHQEGSEGSYIGTDINPNAGELLLDRYRSFGNVMIGDSIKSLESIQEPINLFINDSDHSSEYERREYETIKEMISPDGLILGDNSHVTDELRNFSLDQNRNYLFFAEKPKNHWYPGAGIGISFT